MLGIFAASLQVSGRCVLASVSDFDGAVPLIVTAVFFLFSLSLSRYTYIGTRVERLFFSAVKTVGDVGRVGDEKTRKPESITCTPVIVVKFTITIIVSS